MSGGLRSMFREMGLVAVLTGTFLGCSEGVKVPNWPDAVPVSGTVTMDGKPLDQAMVLYIPDESTVGQGGSGKTDASGKYSISGRNAKGETVPGVVPGKYRVAISRMVKPDGSVWTPDATNSTGPATSGAREELPLEYSDPRSSAWLVDIIPSGPPQDFVLEKK